MISRALNSPQARCSFPIPAISWLMIISFLQLSSANLPAVGHRWWWRGALEKQGHPIPLHTYPFPILAFKTRFILFPFQSAEHQVVLGLVSYYLALHSFQLFSLCWGWEIGIGEAVWQETYRMTGLVRWELYPKKPQGILGKGRNVPFLHFLRD